MSLIISCLTIPISMFLTFFVTAYLGKTVCNSVSFFCEKSVIPGSVGALVIYGALSIIVLPFGLFFINKKTHVLVPILFGITLAALVSIWAAIIGDDFGNTIISGALFITWSVCHFLDCMIKERLAAWRPDLQ